MDYLESNLADIRKNIVENDFDWLMLNTGIEGSGKSMLALYMCKTIDKDFNASRVAFDANQFFTIMPKVPKGGAILLDEGGEVLFSRDAMSTDAKKLIKFFMRARAKNLFFVVNIPDYFMLDKNIRKFRVRSMTKTKVIVNRNTHLLKRGFYDFFTRRKVLQIKIDYKGVPHFPYPTFSGRWANLNHTKLWYDYQVAKNAYLDKKGVDDAMFSKPKKRVEEVDENGRESDEDRLE